MEKIVLAIKKERILIRRGAIWKEQNKEIHNVLLTRFDIERIMMILGEQDNIKRIYINFCNPWPKGQHRKKRLTHTRQLEKYKTFLADGGDVIKNGEWKYFTNPKQFIEVALYGRGSCRCSGRSD